MLLVVEEQNSTCSRLHPPLLFISKAHGLKAHGMSQASWVINDKTLAKKLPVRPKTGWRKKKRKAIAKLFALHANAKKMFSEARKHFAKLEGTITVGTC